MPLIAYLPWLVLPRPTDVGGVAFHPWNGPRADGLESVPPELGVIAGMYYEIDGQPVREGVLVAIHDGRTQPCHLNDDDSDNQRVMEAVHLLFVACLIEQQRGRGFRPEYVNGSALELYFQRYTEGALFCSPVSKRMGDHVSGAIEMQETHFSRPAYAGHQGKPDAECLRALSSASPESRTTIHEAAKLLMVGLSDASYLTESVEVAIVTMALERLVGGGMRNTFANSVRDLLTHPLECRTDRIKEARRPAMFAENGIVPFLVGVLAEQRRTKKKGNLLSEEPSVILHWAADLYMVRNDATHGGNSKCVSAWSLNEHKRHAMAAACFMIQRLLGFDAGYEMTPDDVGRWHSFSHRVVLKAKSGFRQADATDTADRVVEYFEARERRKRLVAVLEAEWARQGGEQSD